MPLIHPTAVIDKKARIGKDVAIGPYSVIGPDVTLGDGVDLGPHIVLAGHTTIGSRTRVFAGACLGAEPQDKKFTGTEYVLEIGSENVIREYVTIHAGSKPDSKTILGDRNYLMVGSHVAHDCVLGNDITIANDAMLAGHVHIEDQAFLSGLVGVHQFVRIGRLAMIGGDSKVIQDVPPFSLCDGHPAVFMGMNVVGLRRAGYASKRALEIRQALKILFASGILFSKAIARLKEEFPANPDIEYLIRFVEGSSRGVPRAKLAKSA